MKWKIIGAATIAVACVTTACDKYTTPLAPSSLPSASLPSSPAPQSNGSGPSLCTNLDECPGGIDTGPAPESSCDMITNGIDVVVQGVRQSSGAWLATLVGQVPAGTQ